MNSNLTLAAEITVGAVAQLSDRSRWRINPKQLGITEDWLVAAEILIGSNAHFIWKVKLTNQDTGESVLAIKHAGLAHEAAPWR
jgi:hypothetical protein